MYQLLIAFSIGLLTQSAAHRISGQKRINSALSQNTSKNHGTRVSNIASKVVVTASLTIRGVKTNLTFDFPKRRGYGLSSSHLRKRSRLFEFC